VGDLVGLLLLLSSSVGLIVRIVVVGSAVRALGILGNPVVGLLVGDAVMLVVASGAVALAVGNIVMVGEIGF